jgi:hypothetical protein
MLKKREIGIKENYKNLKCPNLQKINMFKVVLIKSLEVVLALLGMILTKLILLKVFVALELIFPMLQELILVGGLG